MDRAIDRAQQDGFDLSRDAERRDAERLREAPALGAFLRTCREAHGLTLAEVAERVGVATEFLERVEAGTEVATLGSPPT